MCLCVCEDACLCLGHKSGEADFLDPCCAAAFVRLY